MSTTHKVKPLAAAIGTAFAVNLMAASAVFAAQNPFQSFDLAGGYQVAEEHAAEGKCGEGKCGAEKKAEGEGKCGEGKCGAEKKAEGEGKCGEGKCGAEKEAEATSETATQ